MAFVEAQRKSAAADGLVLSQSGAGFCTAGKAARGKARLHGQPVRSAAAVEADCAVVVALGRALEVAGREGYSRAHLAERLGVSVDAVNQWFRSGRYRVPPDRLAELLVREDVLPAAARVALFNALAQRGGLVVCLPASIKPSAAETLQTHMLDVVAAQGRLVEGVRAAAEPGSDGGKRVTAVEVEHLVALAQRVQHEAAGVVVELEAMRRGAGKRGGESRGPCEREQSERRAVRNTAERSGAEWSRKTGRRAG